MTKNQQIIFAANQAMGLLALQNPDLAEKIKTKHRQDGYKYSLGLQALIMQTPPQFHKALTDYYSNPAAVKEAIGGAFENVFKGLANNLAAAATKTAQAPLALAKGLAGIQVPNFLAALVNPHTWLRVAEVGIGVLLVAVGVAKLTNAVGIANKISGAVGKIPIPV